MVEPIFPARIHAISYGAENVLMFELRAPGGEQLPAFTPGAHIDILMPGGLNRSYSLLNDAAERDRYVVGIKRETASRGGSTWMHETARVGNVLEIAGPRNNFTLDEEAPHSVLIAGGIGITPLWSMIQRLQVLRRGWTLHYRTRRRVCAPLMAELSSPGFTEHVHASFGDDPGVARLDLARVIADSPSGAHFYCCGPTAMMEAFESACTGMDNSRVHLEYFMAKDAPATAGGFTVRLARSGRVVPVEAGTTILESLRACGVNVPSSCQQGVCGACETRVISGKPDHRDMVLSDVEKAAGDTMMICCSGALTPELTLDI
jgi:ferredoxin-NADP reductase